MTDERIRALAHELLESGVEHLSETQRRAIMHIAQKRHVSRNASQHYDEEMTFGQRLSDNVAKWGGSWFFVSGFGIFLVAWALLNSWLLTSDARFDPYPYIFLNLILSMIAAIQAPIIMMSQNRQAAKDRIEAQLDYEVNLKAELEIMALHDKHDRMHAILEQIAARKV
jgi:uncharacterized membrane protein